MKARISHSLRWISTIAEVQRAHGRKYKIDFCLHQLKKGDITEPCLDFFTFKQSAHISTFIYLG